MYRMWRNLQKQIWVILETDVRYLLQNNTFLKLFVVWCKWDSSFFLFGLFIPQREESESLQSHLWCRTWLIFYMLEHRSSSDKECLCNLIFGVWLLILIVSGTDLVGHNNHKKRLKVYDALLEKSLIFLTMLALRHWTHVDHMELLWSRSNFVHGSIRMMDS